MKSLLNKLFRRNEEEDKILLPKWSVDLAKRLDITQLQLADSLAKRSVYNYLSKPFSYIVVLYFGIIILVIISYALLKGQDMTIPATRYVPVNSMAQPVAFSSLKSELVEEDLHRFVKECIEGLYTLNSNTYVQTFIQHSNRCVRATSQVNLISAFTESGLDALLTPSKNTRNQLSKARMIAANVNSIEVKGKRDAGSAYEYGVEVTGTLNRTDFMTGQSAFVSAKWQIVVSRVNEFVSPDGFVITRHRLMWEYQ